MQDDRVRRRLRVGSVARVLVGRAALALGLSGWPRSWIGEQIPLAPGARVDIPTQAAFGGTVALYGTPSADRTPAPTELGCLVTGPSGRPLAGALSQRHLESLDRLVIHDTAVLPLLQIVEGPGDASLTCTGPAATGSQPMYLVSRAGAGAMVPMAAFSLATLALVLGSAGVLTLRPAD